MLTDVSLLTQSPGPMARHPHSGANYHEGADIIAHLNRCLGPAGWSWTTGEHGYDELADQVYVVGTLTARVVVEQNGDELVIGTAHTERGWQKVNRKRGSEELVDLGNDYKAADTDALKRAARLVGVGLDAWTKTSGQSAVGSTQSGLPTAHSPLPTASGASLAVDLSPAGREDLAARYVELLARARGLDFRASWTAADHRTWSDVQLTKYVDLLVNYLKRQESAA